MAGQDVYYKKTKRAQTIRRQQLRTTAILFSFPFVGVVQPTGWQGTMSTTKERKENDQAVTIDKNRDPVLFSLGRRRSTNWMAGHNNVYYKRKKRTIRLQQLTTTAIPERQSTTLICHCQEKAKSNCVLLLSNWSESILPTNGVENILPRINLGLECSND
jgi:hypothetical protein